MDNSYSSISQILADFSIEEESPESIRAKLRSMQSSIHPDRCGGNFASKEDEALFHKMSEAIQFLDHKTESDALVPISAVTDLTNAVAELVKSQRSDTPYSLSEQIKGNIESYQSRFKLPKIALSAITIALSAVWLFPNTIKEHPILGDWFDISDPFFKLVWFFILCFTVLYWILSWVKEEKQKSFQESLKTEMIQNKIFYRFLNSHKSKLFALEDLVEYIMEYYSSPFTRPFSAIIRNPKEINMPMAHTIADLIIKRALSRKTIRAMADGSISEQYKLVDNNAGS